ncbi:glycoside hydrolase family 31 protein [Butyrivibrio sp. VCB2006]|uniref:glycoside hydrolase family 31 protein n=1 Tax=Butyrivibrio sp. VCB2006 TaxID=1280679 RepID=UPI0004148661|nr:TIM-barrel domain-containing protein [Butyrivibrio sp. VCB2006]
MKILREILSYQKNNGAYILQGDCADIKLLFLTDEILRIRASFDREFPEESYVLMTTAWEDRLDELFAGERKRLSPFEAEFSDENGILTFSTGKLTLKVRTSPAEFVLEDSEGNKLYSTEGLYGFVQDSNNRNINYSRMKEEDCFYGFGEKTGELNKNKLFLRERATDSYAYDPVKCDTLYKHVPFYIRLDRDNKKAVGLFYHNFYESVFNMGCEKSNYFPRYSYFQADGGDIDLFILGGSKISKIIDNYTLLTGRPALLPKRALGYQGSSMYYSELPSGCDDALLDFVDTVQKEGIPIDGFHLSSGYTSIDNKRYVFTWNKDRFKNPKEFFEKMDEEGAQVVPNVKPGILLSHPNLTEFQEKDVFIKDSNNPDKPAVGKWWGGDGLFWDFTNKKAREAWKEYLKKNLIEYGTNSIWNDNCEYDGLMDKDAVVSFDGKKGTLGQLKAVMPTLMCKLSNEAVIENNDNARPYSVCRSGSSGIQKYAQTWVGDNVTSWESLKNNVPTILGMGLSGQPNEGADIGGFAGPAPTEELFVRWVQQGIFQGRFSIHSASDDNTVTEPWMYRNSKELIRDLIRLRYRFIPYLYSLEYEGSVIGAPIMRPLVYEFQEDEEVYDESFEYMFGKSLLVANVLEEGAVSKRVYLPSGCKWFDVNDNYREYEGGQTIIVSVSLGTIPMFVREGAIVPIAINQPMNLSKDHITDRIVILAPSEKESSFTIYDDDGETLNYKWGIYKKTTVTMAGTDVVNVSFDKDGDYHEKVKNTVIEMIKRQKAPLNVTVEENGRLSEIPHFLSEKKFSAVDTGWFYDMTKRVALIKYKEPEDSYKLTVSYEQFDLIGM